MKEIIIVIPSFKRENWLLEFVPNMLSNLLVPCNKKLSGTKLLLHIYVQNASCLIKELKDLNGTYVDIIFSRQRDDETLNEIRMEKMKTSFMSSDFVSHVVFMDDDIYLPTPDIADEFASILNNSIIQDGLTSVSGIPGNFKKFISYDNKKHYLNSTLFQIFPRKFFLRIFEFSWVSKEILYTETFFDDTIILLLTIIAGSDLKLYCGLEDFLHIAYFLNLNYSRNYSYKKEYDCLMSTLNDKFHFCESGTHVDQKKLNSLYRNNLRTNTFITNKFKSIFTTATPLKTKDIEELRNISKEVLSGKLDIHTNERIL